MFSVVIGCRFLCQSSKLTCAVCFLSAKTDEALRAKVAKREEENKKKQEEGETPENNCREPPREMTNVNRTISFGFDMNRLKKNVDTITTQQHKEPIPQWRES